HRCPVTRRPWVAVRRDPPPLQAGSYRSPRGQTVTFRRGGALQLAQVTAPHLHCRSVADRDTALSAAERLAGPVIHAALVLALERTRGRNTAERRHPEQQREEEDEIFGPHDCHLR